MNLVKSAATYLRKRRFERRYACRVHSEGEILQMNRHLRDSISVGANTHIRGQLFTFGHGGRISMGSYCYLGDNSKIWSAKEITIGDRVLIAHNSSIFDSDTHPMNATERHRQYVEIIGCNVVVLKGVTIGRAAVVGAGSIVTKDVPPHVLVAGNPARVVRELSPNER